MTDLLPDAVRAEAQPACTAARHADSDGAWHDGCRCPGAVAAHDRHLAKRRVKDRKRPAQVDEHGNCVAERHGSSEKAWLRGCRCPAAVGARERVLADDRARYAGAKRWSDPAAKWRGPNQKVSPIGLQLLLSGFVTSPTNGERLAATWRLMRTGNRWGTGLNDNVEIAARLGVDTRTVGGYKRRIEKRRERRHLRRLADVQSKQHRRELAVAAGRGHDRSGHKPRGNA